VNISTLGFNLPSAFIIKSYTGTGPYDESPQLKESTITERNAEVLSDELPPVSFNIISIKLK
jgi:hypothetical protein